MARPLPSDVFRLGDALDAFEKLVTLALLDYGPRAFPAQQTLAVKTGLSRRTVQRCLDSLRRKGVLTTRSTGKALTYVIELRPEMRQADAPCCVTQTQEMRPIDASDASHRRRDPNESNGTSQPNQQPATPAGGWGGIPSDLRDTIRRRDDGADLVVAGQLRVVTQQLAGVGITAEADIGHAWRLLCKVWATVGRRPYDTVQAALSRLDGAKDVRALVMYRLRGAA
jgi:hypothetical protein